MSSSVNALAFFGDPDFSEWNPTIRHDPLRSLYDASVKSEWVMSVRDQLHIARLNIATPLVIYLPTSRDVTTGGRLWFMYVSGQNGSQISLRPQAGSSDTINGNAPNTPVNYSIGSTPFALIILFHEGKFFVMPVSVTLGGGGGGGSTVVAAGSAISVSLSGDTYTVTNTLPDQVVTLSSGIGMLVGGTYPNFSITNSAPDQLVTLSTGAGIGVTGTYPNFTITNTSPNQTVNLAAGAGISVSGSYPSYTVTNSSPDQLVTLTSSTPYITVSGTYPNFSISSSLLAPSFIRATSSAASLAVVAGGTLWPTAFVKASGSTEWTVDGSGGLVYSGAANGRALWFSIDYKQTSSSTGTGLDLEIVKNADNYPIYTTDGPGFNWVVGAWSYTFNLPYPVPVEPGDVFRIRFFSASGTLTAPSFVWNIAAAQ